MTGETLFMSMEGYHIIDQAAAWMSLCIAENAGVLKVRLANLSRAQFRVLSPTPLFSLIETEAANPATGAI